MSLLKTDNIVDIDGINWQIYRKFKSHLFKDMSNDHINQFTKELQCDKVFKKEDYFYFMIEIKEAEIL